jgi:hypothetical protein
VDDVDVHTETGAKAEQGAGVLRDVGLVERKFYGHNS